MPALEKFMRRPEVEAAVGYSTATIYELISKGKFPKPVKSSGRNLLRGSRLKLPNGRPQDRSSRRLKGSQ